MLKLTIILSFNLSSILFKKILSQMFSFSLNISSFMRNSFSFEMNEIDSEIIENDWEEMKIDYEWKIDYRIFLWKTYERW